jgi:hypothetical protein
MLIAIPSLIGTLINYAQMNCEPWSVLKIVGLICFANASTQDSASTVTDSRHARMRRVR